jgi:Family of unknown function (DUF6272)
MSETAEEITNMLDAYTFYRNMKADGIIFSFTGPTSQNVVESIGELLRRKMELEETKMAVSLKVFSIFVEQMQNVLNYSAEKEPPNNEGSNELHYGMVTVGKKEGHFYILSGNYIARKDTTRIQALLDRLLTMGKDELKSYYLEQRRKGPDEKSKGAGLGLIETARKASRLEYSIVEADKDRDFITINAVI